MYFGGRRSCWRKLPRSRADIALFLPLILIMVIFYFLMIMPAQRRQKKVAEMLTNLKNWR